jgi:predicted enzyme related to lactoylglutathione lyase
MVASIRHITFDAQDSYAQTLFWAEVTGWTEDPDEPNDPGHEENFIGPADGPIGLLFINVPDGPKTTKNRLHLDVQPDTTRDEEVGRLLGIGATLVDDRRRPDGSGWVVLADPEGNEFCVERSESERGEA